MQHGAAFPHSRLQFSKLRFHGHTINGQGPLYKQFFVRTAVDTRHPATNVLIANPPSSLATSPQMIETRNKETSWVGQITGSVSSMLGITIGHTRKTGKTRQITKHQSRVTKRESRGVVWWDYCIDDEYQQEFGLDMTVEMLPEVEFEFLREDYCDFAKPPELLDVEVASYWTQRQGSEVKQNTITAAQDSVAFANFCQIAVIRVPSELKESLHYGANLNVSAYSAIPPPCTRLESSGTLNVRPCVRVAGASPEQGSVCSRRYAELTAATEYITTESWLSLPTLRVSSPVP